MPLTSLQKAQDLLQDINRVIVEKRLDLAKIEDQKNILSANVIEMSESLGDLIKREAELSTGVDNLSIIISDVSKDVDEGLKESLAVLVRSKELVEKQLVLLRKVNEQIRSQKEELENIESSKKKIKDELSAERYVLAKRKKELDEVEDFIRETYDKDLLKLTSLKV